MNELHVESLTDTSELERAVIKAAVGDAFPKALVERDGDEVIVYTRAFVADEHGDGIPCEIEQDSSGQLILTFRFAQ